MDELKQRAADDIRRRWASINPLDIGLTPAMEAVVKDVYKLFEYIDALEEESAGWQKAATEWEAAYSKLEQAG